MKLKTTAWHAKLYDFTYAASRLPKNLCPYFWKVLAGIALFIPNFILQLPVIVYSIFDRNYKNDCYENRIAGFFFYFLGGLATLFIAANYHLIKAVFDCYSYDNGFATSGLVCDLIVLVTILIIFSVRAYDKWKERETIDEEEKSPNILVEFVKAKYSRYCPTVEWYNPEGEN